MHAGAAARILAAGPGRLRNLELGKTVEGVWLYAPAGRSWARPTHLRRSAQAGEATQRRTRLAVPPRAWLSPTLAGFYLRNLLTCAVNVVCSRRITSGRIKNNRADPRS